MLLTGNKGTTLKITKSASTSSTYAKIDAANDTVLRTEDLIKILEADKGPWSEPMSADDLQDEMDSWK